MSEREVRIGVGKQDRQVQEVEAQEGGGEAVVYGVGALSQMQRWSGEGACWRKVSRRYTPETSVPTQPGNCTPSSSFLSPA